MPVPRGDLTRSAVLAALGTSGPLSRTDIARTLGVSPATVTQIVKDLLARGLVAEVEHRPSRGGRPAVLLGLVGSAGRALGAKVAADHVAVVDVRLDGQVRQSWDRPFDAMAADAPDRLVDLLRPLVEAPAGDDAPILGVGVGVPGAVDDQEAGAVDAPTLGWRRLALGARLRAALPVPVLVENDVNALAVAERLYGRGREHRNFLVVTIGRGVGAGLVVDGSVYRGAGGGAGEFGHFPVQPGGPRCSCGNAGCLEASVGQEALLRAAHEAGLDAPDATIFAAAGELFGRGVAGLINVMDPEIVIVLGEGTRAWEHWRPGFEPSLRAHLMPSRRGVPVVVESWDDTSWALGAAALVLATPYDAAGATGGQGELVRARLGGALAGELP
ncbi:ROK family transcriptional regulator [Jiangella alkaliphila]|uniref:Sugar kinase of the NBD/HSP70 family, may contain an N-terminal HTH domain n=1 Tax=Jiangella alkaliphila TaxID=419479 RepID=A0A1H2GNU0_9ACTN|nr:ROK family transcriptional regulator [Jiangella alkaliphila]SDU21175.1 Sugar kinase of the NBD/HSP70 family, may contain an N-terminal HTH domain [Jiangella alkaliphila]